QEGGTTPVDGSTFDTEPNSLTIGNRDLADGSFGGQYALDAADADDTVGRGKLILQQGGEKRAFLFRRLGRGILRQCETSGNSNNGDEYDPDQNACPIPT